MALSLQDKRKDLLKQIARIQRLRRGQLSEQYYEKTDAQGRTTRQGPYYVWQAWVRGKKRSVRVQREELPQLREDLKAYQQYRQLCEELADVNEQLACEPRKTQAAKKNARKPAKRSTKNSRHSSTSPKNA